MINMKQLAVLVFAAALTACGSDNKDDSPSAQEQSKKQAPQVAEGYIAMAQELYGKSLNTAETLKVKINAFTKAPTEANLKSVKDAWLAARVPYQQSEVFRFGNKEVDDWEGKLNAWPLDEGLIDYVDASYSGTDDNKHAKANVIKNQGFEVALSDGKKDKADVLDKEFLGNLQEYESESNVATGYHAIEFLLWGQDLNGTKAGSGNRPAADYATSANFERRAVYLRNAVDLLVDDLKEMVDMWKKGGQLEKAVSLEAVNDAQGFYKRMFLSLAKLSAGELAGERMNVALENHSVEDEHDCFSDNTHNSHYYNTVGLSNLLNGTDGKKSLADIIALYDNEQAEDVKARMATALKEVKDIKLSAEKTSDAQKFDQLIGDGNTAGNKVVKEAVDALKAAGNAFTQAAKKMGISVTTGV